MPDSTPHSTPKRKHTQFSSDVSSQDPHTAKFSFEVPSDDVDDGNGSPRTKVAHKFKGLALEGGGGVNNDLARYGSPPSPTPSGEAMDVDTGVRKRIRLPEDDDTAQANPIQTPAAASEPAAAEAPKGEWATSLQADVDPAIVRPLKNIGRLEKSYPSINRLSESKSRRKRAGTPPLVGTTTKAGLADQEGDPEAEIVEPVRASLTWHEDEITVYDPDDEDDDGTGINGIGFKPTAAIAYARTMKRKQQLAEYKKREEREARAKRSQRRRGSPELETARPPQRDEPGSPRKVRFMEFEPSSAVTT